MSIVRNFVNLLASISNIVFGLLYIEIFEKKRNASKQIRLLLVCLTFISFFISTFVVDKIFVRSIVLLCILFMLSFYYDCTFLKRIYLLISFFSFFCISEIITGMISMAVLKMTINEIRQSDILYIANIFASQLLIFMMVKIAGFYMRNKNKTLDKKTEIAMVLLMLPTVFAVLLMGEIVDSYSVERTILASALTVLMSITSITTLYLTERQMKLKEYELEIKELENQYRLQVQNYENLREQTRATNRNIHDIKNFTLAIGSYLEQGKVDEAQKKLKEYTESISAVAKRSCGNRTVDALLAAKQKELDQVCADCHVSVVLNELVDKYEIDFCILIGNAIDNAIEESRRIENRADRYIEIRIMPNAGGMSVFVRNKTNGYSEARGKTVKGSDLFHGFGIENMKTICEKHNGDLKISEHDGLFDLSIFLPNIQEI